MNITQAQTKLQQLFKNKVSRDKKISNAYMLIHSDKLGIHLNMAEGTTEKVPATPQQPYFIASVGKLFTAALIAQLVEQEKLSYEDPITRFLEPDLLHGLHTYKGTDYTAAIKIKHLLNHTSGLHDFFEGKPQTGKPIIDLLVEDPTRFWTPQEAIHWSKTHLQAHFPPGKGFHYSDTGYHLLGLIIEQALSIPFHEALNRSIFQPLQMNNSYLLHYSDPLVKSQDPLADVYINSNNVKNYRSLSIDYAGGGIVSTSEDLLKFMQALVTHTILRKDSVEKMREDRAFFSLGIEYSYGIMNFKAVPIFMPKKYTMWGNAGITGSFMFYHPQLETYLIGSLNQFYYNRKGIMLIFKMLNGLHRLAK